MKAVFKGVMSAGRSLLFGLISSVMVGVLVWGATYPIKWYDCKAYGESKEIAWKFRFFECYVKTDSGWMTKQEYQSAFVGTRLLIDKPKEDIPIE